MRLAAVRTPVRIGAIGWLTLVILGAFSLGLCTERVVAQVSNGDLLLATAGPRFLARADGAPTGGGSRWRDVSNAAVFRQRISLELTGVPRGRALEEIARKAGLRLTYSAATVSLESPITLSASELTVGAALSAVLYDAGVDVLLTSPGQAALIARVQPEQSQVGAIVGRVTDERTGTPLVGASVVVDGTSRSATAGNDGRYRIAELAPGTYTVRGRFIGYAPLAARVSVSAEQEAVADFGLERSLQRLDEVVTTGTLVPTEVKALASPVSVITAEQIEQQQIRNYSDLLRQLVPGMVTWENGSRPDRNTMSARGATTLTGLGQLKVYIDGVQVTSSTYSQVDPQSIERIEVVRGPQAAALYGSDAIGGVIEIFTKRGDPALQRLEGSVQAAAGGIQSRYRDGAALRQDYHAELRGARGNASFNLGGGYARDGEWIDRFAAARPSAFAGMRFEQGAFALDLTARYYGQNFHYPFDPVLKATGFSSFQAPQYTRFGNREETYGVQLRYRVTPSWQHQLIVGADRYLYTSETYQPQLRTPSDTLLGFQEISYDRLSVAYRSALTARLSPALQAVLTAGLDYSLWRYSFFDYTGTYNLIGSIAMPPTTRPGTARDRSTNAGYFAQAQLGFRDALFLTGSARLEQNSNFGDEIGSPVSPRVGLSFVQALGGATLKLRSAYGEALQAPQSAQKTGSSQGSRVVEPNPELRPERQVGPEFGADLAFGATGSLGVTYYRQTAKDLIALAYLPPQNGLTVVRYQNAGRVRNEGVEVEGKVGLAGIQLTGQYAYTKSQLLDPGPDYTGVEQVGEQISSVPQHTVGATVSLTPLRRLGVTAGMTYVGVRHEVDFLQLYSCFAGTGPCHDYFTTGDLRAFWSRIPGFAKVSLSVDCELRRGLTPYLTIENLTNSNPVEQSSTTALPGRITMVGLRLQY